MNNKFIHTTSYNDVKSEIILSDEIIKFLKEYGNVSYLYKDYKSENPDEERLIFNENCFKRYINE